MSHTHHTAASSSSTSPNFQLIINSALDTYNKRTRKDLRAHPLAAQLQACESPTAILAVLQQQVQDLDRSRTTDGRWTKWLDPTVNVLYNFSNIIGAGVGLVFSPASVIFAGVGVLLSTAKDVRASDDTLVDVFERIEMFFRRLQVYTEARPTTEMMVIVVQIVVEMLSILGIATKEIKQGRIKKYAKKLIGRTEIEDALKRLDKLTHEEAWMGIAENLRATNTVGESVKGVADKVEAIDNGVAEVIRDGQEVKSALQQMATVTDVDQVRVVVQQTAANVDQVKRHQSRETIHKWLSPPDPSTNHNIACGTHHKKSASWFFQGSIFREWKSSGSLLWVHGKPGSGKSVLCSTVIQNIETMCKAGNASMAYFYFDFRDAGKQGLHDLLSSLLTQLSARSGRRCDILSGLYSDHDDGKNQPSDSALAECLKTMLTLPDQLPTYLIIDALDESSNTSGIPSPRERALHLLKELVELRLPNLHICVTSRPEIDIRDVLEPLTNGRVSLHDQTGQKQDIVDYVKSVVYSNSEPIMKRWRTDDKELVVHVLSERADGMFRWIFCQLEVLRHCLPPSVRQTLDELPESLDDTYERVLKEIKKPNRVHAIRLLQCLVVAIRPLRVEELAEVLAVDFRDEGMPKLNPDWRWGNEEQALLASCSSLIAIVELDGSRVVQFSHFSVKEYLTSDRLATSSGDISRYYIDLQLAHTILAQACMSILLRSEDRVEEGGLENGSPLAGYAAEHWVVHAQDEKVSSCIRKAMEYLFDVDKPYFSAWLELYDIDIDASNGSTFYQLTERTETGSVLYYAARCGFQDLAEHLVANDPKMVNVSGGYYVTPLVAALAGGHFRTAEFLYDNGAHPNVKGYDDNTPLHSAAYYRESVMARVLLQYKANADVRNSDGATPLHFASRSRYTGGPNIAVSFSNVAQLLVEHGADPNARTDDKTTPLHEAAKSGVAKAVRLLLELGADVNARKNDDTTPLHNAARSGSVEAIRVLLEHGADSNVRKNDDTTLLHEAARSGRIEAISVLLELGADVNARKNDDTTSLHEAAQSGSVEAIRMLLELGADVNARKNDDTTPFHEAAQSESVEAIRVLLEHGADVNARMNDDTTPLHEAARNGSVEAIRVLLEHGADTNARMNDNTTPLHEAARSGSVEAIRVLLELGADVNARMNDDSTPLHVAVLHASIGTVRMLLELGADVDSRKTDGTTPLNMAAKHGYVQDARALLEHGANVGSEDGRGRTASQVASEMGQEHIIALLSEHGTR